MDELKQMIGTGSTGIITAQHGWGYDWRTYASWSPALPAQWQLTLKNRGYFKESSEKIIAPLKSPRQNARQILVCHSFGLHLLESDEIKKSDLLVIISSFANFHLNDNPQSKKAIKRMIMRLTCDPHSMLQDFYAACTGETAGSASPLPEQFMENCNLELLITDLKKLDHAQVDLNKIDAAKSILILHGGKDAIVPVEAAKQLHERLTGSALSINQDAGHALPLTHPQWCLEQIFKHETLL
jgi:hypothetical protein